MSIAAVAEPRVPTNGPKLIKEGDRYHSYAVNLNHNMLTGALETLPDFIRRTLIDPNNLSILDLSFNVFTEIPTVSHRLTSIFVNNITGKKPLYCVASYFRS